MNKIEIEKKLREAIGSNINSNIDFLKISEQKNLFDMGLDSVGGIKLLVVIEEQFEIEFFDDEYNLENFKTIESIVNLIQKHKS